LATPQSGQKWLAAVRGKLNAVKVADAHPDPAALINNLGKQLRVMSGSTSQQQKLAGFHEFFRENFDVAGLSRFVLGRFWRIFTPQSSRNSLGCSRISWCSPIARGCWSTQMSAVV
jgi:hypothetical protein